MKSLLLTIISLFIVSASQARDVSIEWDEPPESNLTVYNVYVFDEQSANWLLHSSFPAVDEAGSKVVSGTIVGLPNKEHQIGLTVCNDIFESVMSDPLLVPVRPGKINNLKPVKPGRGPRLR